MEMDYFKTDTLKKEFKTLTEEILQAMPNLFLQVG